jgi:hypothetical protein
VFVVNPKIAKQMNKSYPNKPFALLAGAAILAGATLSGSAQSLIDQWNFNETSGTTAANSVGGGASATLMGGATFDGSGSAVLNGTAGTYIDLGNALNGLTSVTMEGWFTYTQVANRAPLITGVGSGGANNGYYLRYSLYDTSYQSPNAYLEANNGWHGGGTTIAETGAPAQNTLEQVAIVYDPTGNYEAIYVNGALAASASGALLGLNIIANSDLQLGQSAFNGDPTLTGTINQFSIYNGALSGTQIANDFAAGVAPVPEPSTFAMVAGGFGMLLAGFRMRKNK